MTAATRKRSEPKGRATNSRSAHRHDVARANRNATLQWVAVFVVGALLILGAGFLLGPSGGDGPTHQRAPIAGHGG